MQSKGAPTLASRRVALDAVGCHGQLARRAINMLLTNLKLTTLLFQMQGRVAAWVAAGVQPKLPGDHPPSVFMLQTGGKPGARPKRVPVHPPSPDDGTSGGSDKEGKHRTSGSSHTSDTEHDKDKQQVTFYTKLFH
jgi:hypothetical protein